jgi:hypothetical protein
VAELAWAVLDGMLDLASLITDRASLDKAPAAFEWLARAREVVLLR